MTEREEVPEEEVVEEEEEAEEEKPRRRKGKAVVEVDLDDMLYKEALKDVLAINEEIPRDADIKVPELREFIEFDEKCNALEELIKKYKKEGKINIFSEDFSLKDAMELAKEIVGIDGHDEEFIEGEPSPYVQELFKKIWQLYVDCKWFRAMLKGKKPTTPKDLKYVSAPEELIKATGEKI
jgi:hypothetical protein